MPWHPAGPTLIADLEKIGQSRSNQSHGGADCFSV
jgi:hypothetical protein